MQQDEAVHAQTAPNSSLVLQVDKGLGKQFFIVLWLSAFISALCISLVIIGGMVLYDAHRVTRQHVKILEYDLQDLRAKTGHVHDNEGE